MTHIKEPAHVLIDPDLLQVLGQVAEVFGLAEHLERVLNTRSRLATSRHRAIDRALARFGRALAAGRGSLRQIRSTLAAQLQDVPSDTIAIAMAYDDFTVFRNGFEQLNRSIREMSKATYELETLTEPIAPEVDRFFRVNEAGRPLLELLANVFNGNPGRIPELLDMADQHFARCERLIDERREWLSGGEFA